WLLPYAVVGEDESAEEALERHAHRELGVEFDALEFAETLYLEDDATGQRYVANVFRVRRKPGELRFRAAGEYDDVRWLAPDELADVAIPKPLSDWLRGGKPAAVAPSAVPVAAGVAAPDNRLAWNTISRAYQDRYQIPTDRLVYAPRCPDEDELQLLGDVSGLRVIVLGCGGGQDCIALAKRGAEVIGIDLSDKQIEYGRRLAERESVLVTLMQGNVELLKGIDDESQDLAVSAHAMNYVERADRAFAEAFRVLRPGAAFVFSVHHPFFACLDGTPPYAVSKGYWQRELDWQWDFSEARVHARMRSWYRPVSEWFSLLTDAGFRVERLLEPPPTEEADSPWDAGYNLEKMRLIPATLIVRVVKP
ncbi:MAG: methyltransferase domain-containing protein, partial [Dehalococcoidia bacterium]|nr:methyltransferase domain-containing protein [Dehalococcoidia bacterium]